MCRQLFSAFFLLLFLFMVLMPSAGNALPPRNRRENENRCECNSVTSSISRNLIRSVYLIPSGPHCNVQQIIAVMNTGNKICLDPEAEWVKPIVQILLNRVNH